MTDDAPETPETPETTAAAATAPAEGAETPAEPAEASAPVRPAGPQPSLVWGLGRRKSSTARVQLRPGSGAVMINGKTLDDFFPCMEDRARVMAPLLRTDSQARYDVFCNVSGGGRSGQSGAIMLGLARAMKEMNPPTYEALREHGLLTRDGRMKERKKYGRRGARRGFQFSKR